MVMHISKAFPLIALHGGSQSSNGQSVSSSGSGITASIVNRGTKRARDNEQSNRDSGRDDKPPKKRGRPSRFHPCDPCTVWLQTGRDSHLARHHISSPMRHSGNNAADMSAYISHQQYNIHLQPYSCIYHGCELDYTHNKNNPSTCTPRWLRLTNEAYINTILCCKVDMCDCKRLQEWGPSEWCDRTIEWWSQYFIHKGWCTVVNTNANAKHICRNLREFRLHLSQRTCANCSLSYACKWYSTDSYEWLCDTCEACDHDLKKMKYLRELRTAVIMLHKGQIDKRSPESNKNK